MAEVLGFFLVLAALALLVGTLAQGPLRLAGFIVLAFIAVLASGPVLQRTPLANFFNSGATQSQSGDPVAPANLPANPDPAAPYYGGTSSDASRSQSGTNSASGGGSTTRRSSTSSTNSSNRSIRGGW